MLVSSAILYKKACALWPIHVGIKTQISPPAKHNRVRMAICAHIMATSVSCDIACRKIPPQRGGRVLSPYPVPATSLHSVV